MVKMGGDAFAGVEEASNRGTGGLGQRQLSGEVWREGKVWDKPIPQPWWFLRGVEDLAIKCKRGGEGCRADPVIGAYPSGSARFWKQRSQPSRSVQWFLYTRRPPPRTCYWSGTKVKKQ